MKTERGSKQTIQLCATYHQWQFLQFEKLIDYRIIKVF